MSTSEAMEPLLSIHDLVTDFSTETGPLRAVNGASYDVMPGESVGIVGESGSGKSVTALTLLGLLPPSASVISGTAMFGGRDLLTMSHRQLEAVRGKEIGMIFQDPMTALNPVMTIGRQIGEGLRRHSPGMSRRLAARRSVELLGEVGIPNPTTRVNQYPHEFSGGMRQRAMIALAMANRPRLVIADEPTTALDVTIQAQILDLLRMVQLETSSALIFITHDLGVIAEMTSRVVVMYAGRVIETADVDATFHDPRHPYTLGLLSSLPKLGERPEVLAVIPGQPPNPQLMPEGCSFRPRCARSHDREECRTQPELLRVGPPAAATLPPTPSRSTGWPGHRAACHFAGEAERAVGAGGVATS